MIESYHQKLGGKIYRPTYRCIIVGFADREASLHQLAIRNFFRCSYAVSDLLWEITFLWVLYWSLSCMLFICILFFSPLDQRLKLFYFDHVAICPQYCDLTSFCRFSLFCFWDTLLFFPGWHILLVYWAKILGVILVPILWCL